jgi:hypothetical protein
MHIADLGKSWGFYCNSSWLKAEDVENGQMKSLNMERRIKLYDSNSQEILLGNDIQQDSPTTMAQTTPPSPRCCAIIYRCNFIPSTKLCCSLSDAKRDAKCKAARVHATAFPPQRASTIATSAVFVKNLLISIKFDRFRQTIKEDFHCLMADRSSLALVKSSPLPCESSERKRNEWVACTLKSKIGFSRSMYETIKSRGLHMIAD